MEVNVPGYAGIEGAALLGLFVSGSEPEACLHGSSARRILVPNCQFILYLLGIVSGVTRLFVIVQS
jgi:hypothetical protein